jgi:hypothetical protein
LYQIHQMRFSDRMVAMMDGSSAWWALRWLVSAGGLSLSQRLTLGSEILGQLGEAKSGEKQPQPTFEPPASAPYTGPIFEASPRPGRVPTVGYHWSLE